MRLPKHHPNATRNKAAMDASAGCLRRAVLARARYFFFKK